MIYLFKNIVSLNLPFLSEKLETFLSSRFYKKYVKTFAYLTHTLNVSMIKVISAERYVKLMLGMFMCIKFRNDL